MRPSPVIVSQIKAYEKKLTVKWNNEYKYFEIWLKKLDGDRLITPVVESIYNDKGNPYKYEKLDRRIIDWLQSADTRKHTKKWKWLGRKRYDERKYKEGQRRLQRNQNIAKDHYNLSNGEFINPLLDKTSWNAPDLKTRSRIRARSTANAKEYFGRE